MVVASPFQGSDTAWSEGIQDGMGLEERQFVANPFRQPR
jgi:predicted nucleic acid-binding protein